MASEMAEKEVKINIELIKKMLNMKLEPGMISKYLNIPVKEVEKIKLALVNC